MEQDVKALHTPGPWSFDHDWRRFPTIFGADKKKVATIEKDGFPAKNVRTAAQEANARLIAAAPELLEALEGICSAFTQPGNDGWFSDPVHSDEVNKARAAIAKATGEQS